MRVSKATYFMFCSKCGRDTPHQLEGFFGRPKPPVFRCKICGHVEGSELGKELQKDVS